MNTIEKIIHNNVVIAVIIYRSHKEDGINFLSSNDYSLQLGYMMRPTGYQILPHIHNLVQRHTVGTQEVLFIKSGEIRVDFYSSDRKFLESRLLSTGDTILFAGAGHGIEVIKEAEIIEVKNGPYTKDADKDRFEGKRGQG